MTGRCPMFGCGRFVANPSRNAFCGIHWDYGNSPVEIIVSNRRTTFDKIRAERAANRAFWDERVAMYCQLIRDYRRYNPNQVAEAVEILKSLWQARREYKYLEVA